MKMNNEKLEDEDDEEKECEKLFVEEDAEDEKKGEGDGDDGDVWWFPGFRGGSSCGGGVCLFVAVLCALGFVEGISVNGLPNINISNLEKRFEMTSSQAGLISSSGEIGAISLVLFVSFYGGRSHRPRVVGAGGFLLALGCFFFLLPHIIVGPYTIGQGTDIEEVCSSSRPPVNCEYYKVRGSASRLLPLFMVGQALQGIGFTPAFTCGFAYIDDHATSEHTAVYIGVTYAITALGVGVGYVLGGQLLSLWVDIGRTDVSKIKITTADKRWVGAWWIGYVICGVLFIVVACILCCFPRYFAGSKSALSKKEVRRTESAREPKKSISQLLLSFPRALFELVRNPLYIILVLVGLGDTLIVSGIAGFAPKIIEEKFNVKPTESGLIMGTVTLIGGAGGMAVGGWLIQRLHLKLRGILKMCIVFLFCGGILGGGCFFIQCPQQRFAGINSIYSLADPQIPERRDLSAECNSNCSCTTQHFDPVCGQDGITYFSACHAACSTNYTHTHNEEGADVKTYNNCVCVLNTLTDEGRNGSGSAVSGQCAGACPQVWPFVFVMFLGILFTFLTVTPISMAILRCVPSAERSVGLGLQWVTLRLLGTIPGPILTGALLDTTCQLWQTTCYGRGNCWMYDDSDMSLRLFLLWVMVKVTALVLLVLAYLYYTKKGHPVVEENEQLGQSMSLSMSSKIHSSSSSKKKQKLNNQRLNNQQPQDGHFHNKKVYSNNSKLNFRFKGDSCSPKSLLGKDDVQGSDRPVEFDLVDLQTVAISSEGAVPPDRSSCVDNHRVMMARVYPTDAVENNDRTNNNLSDCAFTTRL